MSLNWQAKGAVAYQHVTWVRFLWGIHFWRFSVTRWHMYVKILEQVSIFHVFLKEVKGKSIKTVKMLTIKHLQLLVVNILWLFFPFWKETSLIPRERFRKRVYYHMGIHQWNTYLQSFQWQINNEHFFRPHEWQILFMSCKKENLKVRLLKIWKSADDFRSNFGRICKQSLVFLKKRI